MKAAIWPFVTKFICFNLAVKFSAANLWSSGLVIYLLWSVILFSTSVIAVLPAKSLILGILFLISSILALREALLTTLVILCISFLTSYILALRVVLAAKLVISGISSSISLVLAICKSF